MTNERARPMKTPARLACIALLLAAAAAAQTAEPFRPTAFSTAFATTRIVQLLPSATGIECERHPDRRLHVSWSSPDPTIGEWFLSWVERTAELEPPPGVRGGSIAVPVLHVGAHVSGRKFVSAPFDDWAEAPDAIAIQAVGTSHGTVVHGRAVTFDIGMDGEHCTLIPDAPDATSEAPTEPGGRDGVE